MINKLRDKYRNFPIQAKASLWFLFCSFLQKGVATITTPIFTRLLSVAEYGEFSVFSSWMQIISIFVTLNLFYGVYTQGLIKFDKEQNVYSSSLQGLTLTLVILWGGIYFLFQEFWNHLFSLSTFKMVSMLLIIWTSAVFQFWAAEQRVLYKYRTLVILSLFFSLFSPLIEVLFVLLFPSSKVDARIMGIVLINTFFYSTLFISQIKKGKVFYSNRFWKYALFFNLPLIFHYLSQVVLSSADRIMIERMVGVEEAGVYSLAYSISMVMTLFNTALSQAMAPWLYQKIKEKKITQTSHIVYISLCIIAAVNLVIIALSPEVVALFAPSNYENAIYIIPPIAMSVFFMFVYDIFARFSFYQEETKLISLASIAGAILNVVLNMYAIRIFGYYAAGYTTLICYITYAVFHYLLMHSICKKYYNGVYPYETKVLLLITGVFMILGFCFLLVYNNTVLRYILLCFFIIIVILRSLFIKQLLIDVLYQK